ncbi:MAG: homoserine kinase [Ignavibacteria bacterium]|nr:homoserine kinase [Ignavibacteria bacterium]
MTDSTSLRLVRKFARAFAPATVSNVGPGFDLIGFPVFGIGDEVEVKPNGKDVSRIISIVGNASLSMVLEENTAGMAIKSFLAENAPGEGVDITLFKNMPIGSGMGSSAASAAAGVAAANALLETPLPAEKLIKYALDGEMVASGTRHGDNIIPCITGGFILITDTEKFEFIKIDPPAGLVVLLIHPHVEIKTSHARSILPEMMPAKNAIKQTSAAMMLVTGLLKSDYGLISAASKDFIAEPYRAGMIPGYHDLKREILANGACAFNISGSGPTSFAFFDDEIKAEKLRPVITDYYEKLKIEVDIFISKVNNNGVKVLEVR